MSVRIMNMVFEAEGLTPNQKLVMLSLADHGNDDGISIYPSVIRTARKTGLSDREVRRTQKELVERKLLSIDENGGGRKTNHYSINIEELIKLQSTTPDQPSGLPCQVVTPPLTSGQVTPDQPSPESLINHNSITNESLFDNPPRKTDAKVKGDFVDFMVQNAKKHEGYKQLFHRLFKINVDFNKRKDWRELLHFLQESGDVEERLTRFANWWYTNDWRGKQGQSPTSAQIREFMPQAEENTTPGGRVMDRTTRLVKDWLERSDGD